MKKPCKQGDKELIKTIKECIESEEVSEQLSCLVNELIERYTIVVETEGELT